ncbi:MAG: sigma-70 family RNA polymerase sigma factor [Spirochaetes bacterium]|nr:sigma-70 family RNA polymerase sigma factor [Spirochaetota bacterium]MBU0954232.1 sigma-70 family RNA polymerase sigma factor [Spirochaetota bacterium]
MDNSAELRASLMSFLCVKFGSRLDIAVHAEDMVQDAFLYLEQAAAKGQETAGRRNFAYLSVVCLHSAYRYFRRQSASGCSPIPLTELCEVVSEQDFVAELLQREDTAEVLRSMETLRQMERIIVMQRYFGQQTFAEIARKNGLNLNTVLSQHRRALEKLRSNLMGRISHEEGV